MDLKIIDNLVSKGINAIDRKVDGLVERGRRAIYRKTLQLLFICLSVVLVSSGAILFLSRFFPLDIILLISGILCIYAAMLFNIMK